MQYTDERLLKLFLLSFRSGDVQLGSDVLDAIAAKYNTTKVDAAERINTAAAFYLVSQLN